MNQNRQQMEATLPEASGNMCRYLWNKLSEAGVGVQQQDLVLMVRMVSDYLKNTPEGKKTALKLLNASVRQAPQNNAYYPNGHAGPDTKKLPHKELVEYRGWIYQGKYSIPYESIEVENNGNLEACESTGILGPKDYCVKTVKTYAGGHEALVNMSNYARLHSEDLNIRSEASHETCRKCPSLGCDYHPIKDSRQLTLMPVPTGMVR